MLTYDMLRSIGMLPMDLHGNQKAVDFAMEAMSALKLKGRRRADLYYHNHHVEFVRYGEFLLDIIRANVSTGL